MVWIHFGLGPLRGSVQASIRALAIAALFALGCGDGGDSSGDRSFEVMTDPGDAHPHTLTIFEEDLDDGLPQTYQTTDGPDHEHAVDITASEIMSIGAGDPVTIELTDGHLHRFDIDL